MRNAILAATIGLMAGTPALADNSYADINQLFGTGHSATIEQTSASNSEAHIWQSGVSNIAGHAVVQDGGGWFIDNPGISQQITNNAFAGLTQDGDRNQGNILQVNASDAWAELIQAPECSFGCGPERSSDNTAFIQQSGFDNVSRIHQTAGSFNYAATFQEGDGGLPNVAGIIQGGMRNFAKIIQSGAGHQAFIRQQ